jgi:hypothetical protein
MRAPDERNASHPSAEKVDEAFEKLVRAVKRVAFLYSVAVYLDSKRALQVRRDLQDELSTIEHFEDEVAEDGDGPAASRRPSDVKGDRQGRGADSRASQINEEICNFLLELQRRGTIDDIHKHLAGAGLSEPRDSLMTRISRLVQQGKLIRPVRGYYTLPQVENEEE